ECRKSSDEADRSQFPLLSHDPSHHFGRDKREDDDQRHEVSPCKEDVATDDDQIERPADQRQQQKEQSATIRSILLLAHEKDRADEGNHWQQAQIAVEDIEPAVIDMFGTE